MKNNHVLSNMLQFIRNISLIFGHVTIVQLMCTSKCVVSIAHVTNEHEMSVDTFYTKTQRDKYYMIKMLSCISHQNAHMS